MGHGQLEVSFNKHFVPLRPLETFCSVVCLSARSKNNRLEHFISVDVWLTK